MQTRNALLSLLALTIPLAATSFSSVHRVFVSTPAKVDPRLVGDCMTLNPYCLKTTDTVDEAIHKLLELGFNGAPVVDAERGGKLVGVISAFDFLQKEETGALLPITRPQEMQEVMQAAQRICATTVGELMTPLAALVYPNTTMKEASEMMLRDRCHRMCVVNEEGQLVGVLATSDVMKDVLSTVRQALPTADQASVPDGNSGELRA